MMRANSFLGELTAVISRSGQAFTQRKVTPESILAVVLFVLSMILLIIEVIPTSGIYLATVTGIRDKYPGLLAMAALIAIISGAPFIHRQKLRPIRYLVAPLAAASGVLSIARWRELFPHTPAAIAVQVLAMLGLVWILAKIQLLQRFSTLYCSSVAPSERELERLLPFQVSYLERLREAILSGPIEQSARVVQLVGNWGQGKSFLIERLGLFLQNDECAVVVINVWEQQGEPDLHLAIVEQILSHEKYWYPYGWLCYPLSFFVARAAKEWRFVLSAGKAATKAEVQIPLTLPRLTGRRYLAQQVDRVRKRGTRTVIVLDEIDRATPRVAQSAMTFARRSLDMPGVVVVLSYVDSSVRYKAFNPLVKSLPDLASTMEAVIFDLGPEKAYSGPVSRSSVLATPGGPFTESDPASLGAWKAWKDAGGARRKNATDNVTGNSANQSEETVGDDGRLAETLRLAFANAGVGQRRRLQEKFSERYLGTDRIQMGSLQVEDVADVVVYFDTVKNRVLRLLGGGELDKDAENGLVQTIVSALRTWQDASPERHEPPTLRKLEGALLRCLSGVDSRQAPGRFSDEFIAAIVLTAYDAAARGMR